MSTNGDSEELLSLIQVAERRGVHYMTVYRHVRTGRLPAIKQNGEWKVSVADLDYQAKAPSVGRPGNADIASRVPQLHDRLLAGDEPGAWSILESCLAAGADPVELHHQLIIPVQTRIGAHWVSGKLRIVHEHTATAIVYRLVSRLGPMMRSKGRSRGSIVIGAVAGDTHTLATTIVSDLLRSSRYTVIDLGGNTPTESFLDTVATVDRCHAIGISVSTERDEEVIATVTALREATPLPVVVGGHGIRDAAHAKSLGSFGFADKSREIVPLFEEAIASKAVSND